MVNEAMPWQLTVDQLRRSLAEVPDGTVVGLAVPPGGLGHPELTVLYNLTVEYAGGPIVILSPRVTDDALPPALAPRETAP
jgi:hypothetical protein